MKFRPLNDKVLIERDQRQEFTPGGIALPEIVQAKDKPQVGTVRAVGPGARREDGSREEMEVAVGDRVMFGPWSGSEATDIGKGFVLMSESELWGVVDEDEEESE